MLIGVGVSCRCSYAIVSFIYIQAVADRLPRLWKSANFSAILWFILRGVSSSSWRLV